LVVSTQQLPERSILLKDREISRREFVAGAAAASTVVAFNIVQPLAAYADRTNSTHLACDVLVCAATPGGIAAAVTAARRGHSVILAEYEDHIGGIVTNGLTNTDLNKAHRQAIGGFFNEFTNRIIAHYHQVDAADPAMPNVKVCRNGFAYEPSVAEAIFNKFVAEQAPRLRVLFRHELKRSVMEKDRVTGAVFEQRDAAGHLVQIMAKVVVDATYEGDLAALSNVKFRLGRESRQELNEPHAGKIYMKFGQVEPLPGSTGAGDKAIQSYCFRFSATSDPTNLVPVEKPEGYDRADYHYLLQDIATGKLTNLGEVFGVYPMPRGKVEFNSQNPLPKIGLPSESLDLAEECWPWPEATPAERRKIYKRYLTHNVGMLWLLQNDPEIPDALRKDARRYGWCKDEFAGNRHLPRQVYVREGRRIEGVYLLTQHDGDLAPGWERTRVQPTSVTLVEWPYDSHACHRFDPAYPGVREGYTFVEHGVFQVPYGVLVPNSVDGLLVPVACSATHIAYNALRMEPVFMALGEACGLAANLAIQNGVELRSVPVGRLQQGLLANGGTITYFEDLEGTPETFSAFQWLGARGLNKGYRAESEKRLSRTDGAERLRRIFEVMELKWTDPTDSKMSDPLQADDVKLWLRSAGVKVDPADSASSPNGLTCEEFALLVYRYLGRA
jgi:ribulose 1,5-bisphosphate synthetase/thiazole synthase